MDDKWLHQGGYRTYQLAAFLDTISSDPWNYARDLEALTLDDRIFDFIEPWPKETLLHRFVCFAAPILFDEDLDAGTLYRVPDDAAPHHTVKWILPVDGALVRYGLLSLGEAFAVPFDTDDRGVKHIDEDACWDYFTGELQVSAAYDQLLERMADEVFHILFHNRRVLAGLNSWISAQVEDLDGEDHLFEGPGRLRRKSPPEWVKHAVLHREQGCCAICKADLTGLMKIVTEDQYDHMVPLALGGLNDVTNIQLLCESCNRAKSNTITAPSDLYARLVPRIRQQP